MSDNKKICPVCNGFLYLKSCVPQWVGSGGSRRVAGVRVVQWCPICVSEISRRMSLDEFKDYSQVMNALNIKNVTPLF